MLTVSHGVRAGALVVLVAGEVDLSTVPRLREGITASMRGIEVDLVVLDLRTVTFIGSHGLRALAEIGREVAERGKSLRIVVDGQNPVLRPIQISGLDRELALYDSLDDALPA
jgi:anti-sigma B factor antagonist